MPFTLTPYLDDSPALLASLPNQLWWYDIRLSMFNPRQIYTLLLWLLLPYVFFHLLWRARKQREYLQHIDERFGRYSAHSDKPIIWLHTVSVGETRAAVNLVQRLRENYPHHQLLLTHTTPTGRAASEQLYGGDVLRVYLPYDYPFAVRRFLQHFRPRIGVLMETEIWFNLIYSCHTMQIPLLLLNARLSEKSAARYARYPNLTRLGLNELSAISAQSEVDAARIIGLGANNVSVMGNLKFDIQPPLAMLELGAQLRTQFGKDRKIFLLASTRAGEEILLLSMLKQVDIPHLLTVIVPRHPQRFDDVADMLTQQGIRFQRKSENAPIASDTQVILGDSMGEMFAYYAACDLTFIGGSLLPFGGQNLIEACAVGKPVFIGPHTYNFAQASQLAVECGAAVRIQNSTDLAQSLQNLLAHPDQLTKIGQAGLHFVRTHRGATEQALRHITYFLDDHFQ
ncbi:lipid IV(A) 3-deoxy-D-manno-octulosonic acid transferase [Candidatus Nitrotoga arctica]|uniref:3-deoxy-D-manno-octulosonic acid transferase n=1 Tax=Candidatus Nitrotoga arctica TaxID=453162 RepID=A0ABM8Z2H5_9PROT|nr:lipid IV(A) 3-deoxy-D-manno-octulosonic acid transferase [Candidatus Nitrotoga arctica]CAG9934030.1 3-deoxy-D-manno-octulosonic acid transferase [Candidatus Nitrotoga arctica]